MSTCLTINTDASYHPFFKVGGFAFWNVYRGERTIQAGPLANPIDATDCELKAIANALHIAIKMEYKTVTKIVVNTDCKNAIAAIRDPKGRIAERYREATKVCRASIKILKDRYKNLANKRRPFFELRYCPAHSEGDKPRLWVNNFLDRAAKGALRPQIKAIQEKAKQLGSLKGA